jgi:hypothetical protein
MDKWTFGITMTIVGVGGTFLTLWVLSVVMNLLKKALPLAAEETKSDKNAK